MVCVASLCVLEYASLDVQLPICCLKSCCTILVRRRSHYIKGFATFLAESIHLRKITFSLTFFKIFRALWGKILSCIDHKLNQKLITGFPPVDPECYHVCLMPGLAEEKLLKNKGEKISRDWGSILCRNLSDVLWEAVSSRQVLSLYQGLGTKNLQSFISQFVYFYGYSYFKRLYLEKSGFKSIGTKANLVVAAAAGACTAIVTQVYPEWRSDEHRMRGPEFPFSVLTSSILQPLDTASSRMQTSEFGKSRGLWETLSDGSWSEAFDGLGISLLLTSNPAIQVRTRKTTISGI